MKKYYCDLCNKEITPADILTTFKVEIGGKETEVNMHAICYYKFKQALQNLEAENKAAEAKG